MKKPNITEGEWKWKKLGDEYYLTGQHGMRPMVLATVNGKIAVRGNRLLEELYPEHPDAKAIEAVPDMIEALMEVYYNFYEDHKYDSGGKGHAVGSAKEALEKAGVNLNAKAE